MKLTRLIGSFIAIFMALPVNTYATITCDPDRSPVTIHAGLNPTVTNLPPRLGMSGAATAKINKVFIQWLPEDTDERVHSAEVTTTDYLKQSQSLVAITDGRTGMVISDIAEAALLPTTNFTSGRIDMEACMPNGIANGLMFAIYGTSNTNVGFQAAPFMVKDSDDGRVATVVANEGTTNKSGLEFNVTGADQILQNISLATDTPLEDIDRVVAENIYQETLIFQFESELETMNMMNNPTEGIVFGNQFIVTGSGAQAYVPHGVTAVFHRDSEVLSSGRVLKIDNKIDSGEHVGALRMRVKGYNDRTITILEGRTRQDFSISDCAGSSRIRSSFDWPSTLEGIITLYKNGVVVTTVSDNLNELVDCDGSEYVVVAERFFEGAEIPARESDVYTLSPD